MKSKIFVILFLLFAILTNAQGRRNNQSTIHVQYGYIPNKDSISGQYIVKVGYSRVIGDKGMLGKVEAFYQNYKISYIDKQVLPYEKYGVSFQAGYSYEKLAPVFLNGWFGTYGGYEKVNKGKSKDFLYNTKIEKVSEFIYGFIGSIDIEILFTRKFAFLLDYTQYYDLKSKFSKSNYGLFGGLKFYIN